MLSQALNTKALVLERRRHESVGLMNLALRMCSSTISTRLRAYNNLAYLAEQQDRLDDAIHAADQGLARTPAWRSRLGMGVAAQPDGLQHSAATGMAPWPPPLFPDEARELTSRIFRPMP